jgi:hypothetical protein
LRVYSGKIHIRSSNVASPPLRPFRTTSSETSVDDNPRGREPQWREHRPAPRSLFCHGELRLLLPQPAPALLDRFRSTRDGARLPSMRWWRCWSSAFNYRLTTRGRAHLQRIEQCRNRSALAAAGVRNRRPSAIGTEARMVRLSQAHLHDVERIQRSVSLRFSQLSAQGLDLRFLAI